MSKKYIYVANWKMNLTHRAAIDFATTHYDELLALGAHGTGIVLCPSFEALHPLCSIFKTTPIRIGAQDCSATSRGSYTGQVSAQSLWEVGCSYVIIGHSERRLLNHESNGEIAGKLLQALDAKIIPIICIGELREEYEANKTTTKLAEQLEPLIEALSTRASSQEQRIIIAYEPVWSIGTNQIASLPHLEATFSFITHQLNRLPRSISVAYLYGGSVQGKQIAQLRKISTIDGFLIGKASIDFQELKKIVE